MLPKSVLKKWIPADRFAHSLRVEKAAVCLAKHWGIDPAKASIAALLHDCGRYVEGHKFVSEAKKFGIKVSEIEIFQPKLLHAKIGAEIAKRVFKVKDKDILSAIAKHTVGSVKMSMLEKIVYIADHIESSRRYKGVSKVRKLAFSDIDSAIVESTSSMLRSLIDKRMPITEKTVQTRNYYLGIKNAG